ncbi:NTF2 fold immunity protein [Fibrella sp. WM1]|uniref:NTF2 fold immunity protein n=1 Tax=Fibrella musci TaxID=3242485 RepID=UPI003520C785
MTTTQQTDIEKTLLLFMSAMNHWERNNQQDGQKLEAMAKNKSITDAQYYATADSIVVKQRKEYFDIFETYAIPGLKEEDKKIGVMGSYGVPPKYDPENESIISTVKDSDTTSYIVTKVTNSIVDQHKYFLKLVAGKWLLYNKLFWIESAKKWIESGGL